MVPILHLAPLLMLLLLLLLLAQIFKETTCHWRINIGAKSFAHGERVALLVLMTLPRRRMLLLLLLLLLLRRLR